MHHFLKISMVLLLSIAVSISIDCPNVINLAIGLNLFDSNPSYPGILTQIKNDCCRASGVVCVSEIVTQINWNSIGLSGFINGTAIPPNLTALSLVFGSISGTIPTLPNSLTVLYLYANLLTGSISAWPTSLINLRIHGNLLNGDIPPFPNSVKYVYLGAAGFTGNKFTGAVVLYQPAQLYISDNWITNVVIQDISQLSSQCILSYNPLLGNPNLMPLTMCTKTGLYSPTLLPNSQIIQSTSVQITKTTVTTVTTTTSAVAQPTPTSMDCPMLISFATGLNMHLKQPAIMTQLNTDCCAASCVTCQNARVVSLYWHFLSLDGSINGTAIPQELTLLHLESNLISGHILALNAPKLELIYLYSNNLFGVIQTDWPPNLLMLSLFGNYFTGNLPALPQSLKYLYLGYPSYDGNQFTGKLIFYRPVGIFILNNLITDIVVHDTFIINECDLSGNPLLGNPNIANLTFICQTRGLYAPLFITTTRIATATTAATTTNASQAPAVSTTQINKSTIKTAMPSIAAPTKTTAIYNSPPSSSFNKTLTRFKFHVVSASTILDKPLITTVVASATKIPGEQNDIWYVFELAIGVPILILVIAFVALKIVSISNKRNRDKKVDFNSFRFLLKGMQSHLEMIIKSKLDL